MNCRFSPAFSAIACDLSISALVFVHDRSKLCLEKLWSKKPTRPVLERFPFSNGLVVRVAYGASFASAMILLIAALFAGLVIFSPGFAWNT